MRWRLSMKACPAHALLESAVVELTDERQSPGRLKETALTSTLRVVVRRSLGVHAASPAQGSGHLRFAGSVGKSVCFSLALITTAGIASYATGACLRRCACAAGQQAQQRQILDSEHEISWGGGADFAFDFDSQPGMSRAGPQRGLSRLLRADRIRTRVERAAGARRCAKKALQPRRLTTAAGRGRPASPRARRSGTQRDRAGSG